jgi:hypothetical protein
VLFAETLRGTFSALSQRGQRDRGTSIRPRTGCGGSAAAGRRFGLRARSIIDTGSNAAISKDFSPRDCSSPEKPERGPHDDGTGRTERVRSSERISVRTNRSARGRTAWTNTADVAAKSVYDSRAMPS